MGYLLKEALKTLCGVNQWSYAVFWKIGCQNPKLLVWDECYYGAISCLGLPENSGEKVHLLVNKMMAENQIKIVGEGLVGRAAFTGSYQWILSENYYRDAHPSEVLKEMCQQVSAGMQTVAVIPILPHGVVQFGSRLKIAEDIGFINDVVSLVLQLGHVPGILLSETYTAKELARGQLPLGSNTTNGSSFAADTSNYIGCSTQTSIFDSQTSFASNSSPFHLKPHEAKNGRAVKLDFSSPNQFINGVPKAEIITSSSDAWMNQQSSFNMHSSVKDSYSSGLKDANLSKTHQMNKKVVQTVLNTFKEEREQNIIHAYNIESQSNNLVNKTVFDDACIQSRSGDDLFDVLGADFKNKFLGNSLNSCSRNESDTTTHNWENNNSSEIYSSSRENSDNLLDAVISKLHHNAKQSLDENVSCRTSLTDLSSSSVSKASVNYGPFGIFEQVKGELLGILKYPTKAKEDSISYSQGSCIYDSWVERGQNVKQNNSVATGYSNKPPETSKPNRKRLKPGENPRPRPKDRQMIQDRVKELREIVPNSAKCSIDALLERTIKHMLFLQGVTKHADKLTPTVGSKIISEDGGLLLKDNSKGGATWAYEVGSQSMVCPIIVEDLNQPHQMLVEMLCEERGLFLEIADIMRGLGLTILKGLMENRNDKIWAHFVVEANRNVTRMEIFLSLVRLLGQNAKTSISSQPESNNDKMNIVQEFRRATSVPATG